MKPVTIMESMITLLYPRRCPVCDGILERKERYVCRSCLPGICFISGPVCCICGKPLEKDREEYCYDCRKRNHVFLRCRAPFLYRGRVKDSLMRFKYLGRAEYASFFGRAMVEFGRKEDLFADRNLIIPVPIHRDRRIERGYNQAELLAIQVSRLTGIPLHKEVVKRKKKTKALKSVSGASRSRNLSDAFVIPESNKSLLFGKKILLIDDIFTTGSTADAISIRLLQSGADSVVVLCLAVSPGFS